MKLKARLMDEAAMSRALMRISHEITEKNKGVDKVVLVGIRRRGVPISERIRDNIMKIENISGICFSSRWTTKYQRHCTVSLCMFR